MRGVGNLLRAPQADASSHDTRLASLRPGAERLRWLMHGRGLSSPHRRKSFQTFSTWGGQGTVGEQVAIRIVVQGGVRVNLRTGREGIREALGVRLGDPCAGPQADGTGSGPQSVRLSAASRGST